MNGLAWLFSSPNKPLDGLQRPEVFCKDGAGVPFGAATPMPEKPGAFIPLVPTSSSSVVMKFGAPSAQPTVLFAKAAGMCGMPL